MISKRKAIVGAIIIVLLTTVLTVTVGNIVALQLGQKVVITKETYDYYKSVNDQHGKLLMLKEYLSSNYYKDLEDEVLMEGAIRGMFESVEDPYTVYMNEKEFNDLMTRTQGTYGGIGVIVTPGEDGFVTVVSPIEDTPGERAGLRTGDKITHVDGERVYADKLDLAVDKMKGDPGTKVMLTIGREGVDPIEVEINREEIRLQTVKSEVLEDNIGYLRISMFDEKTAEDFTAHLKALEGKNIEGLVIDLRNNPGGLLSQCIEIADRLLGEQVIVYTEDKNGNREIENSDKAGIDYPLVLIVNEGSASASEILAGAVKDGGQGIILGTTTFGKGLVQQVKPLNDGTGFKYTISQYFTPDGNNIHGIGIVPDIVVELPEELKEAVTIERAQDTQFKKAIEEIKGMIGK